MRGRDPQCARREIKVSVHAQWLEDAFWAKRLERDLGLGLGQVGGQGYADVAVLALCSGSPLIQALFGVVVFSFGLEIGGERFAQRFWKVSVFYPGVLQQVPVVAYAGGVGEEMLQGDRNLRVLGIPDGEGEHLVDVGVEGQFPLLHQLHHGAGCHGLRD